MEPIPGVGEVVGMKLNELSLPGGKVAGVSLSDNLSGAVKHMVDSFEDFMLQDASVWTDLEAEASALQPFTDPLLADRKEYLAFLKKLFVCGVLSFTQNCRGRVGAFCVSKKPKIIDGKTMNRQRLVLDCRAVNLQFKDPPRTELGSLASLSDLHIPDGSCLFVSTADIRDCFYACDLPAGMEQFFCLHQDISVEEARDIAGSHFDFDTWSGGFAIPCIKVLPMGFNWSFYLVQVLHEQASVDSLGIDRTKDFLDGHPAPYVDSVSCATMPYCDNVHVLSFSSSLCQEGKDRIVEKLEGMGFELHEHTSASTLTATLGGIIDGQLGHIRCSNSRIWSLIFAFEYCCNHKVSVELVQRLLGHAMFACVLNRSGMALFRRLYDFVQSNCKPRYLNSLEQRECRVFAGILPLLVADLRLSWDTTVTATDASPSGWGICERFLPSDQVEEIGKWHERWRYRRLDPSEWQPRQRALSRCVFTDPLTVKGTLEFQDDCLQYKENADFPEVDHGLLNPADWGTVGMGMWKHKEEHITMKEARCLLIAVRRLSRAQRHRRKRHLVLVDNLSLCFALGKGRAHNFGLLRVLEQIGSICLAATIVLRGRWIPSEKNIADGPSRGQILAGPFTKASVEESKEAILSSLGGGISQTTEARSKGFEVEGYERQCSHSSETSKKSFGVEGTGSELQAQEKENCGQIVGCSQRSRWKSSAEERDNVSGEKKHQCGGPGPIRDVLPSVRGLLQGQRFASSIVSRGVGCHVDRFHGRSLSGQPRCSRRGKDSGGSRIQHHIRQGKASQSSPSPSRLAQSNASAEQAATPQGGHVWNSNEFSCCWLQRDGSYGDGSFFPLSSTRRSSRHQSLVSRGASEVSRVAVPVCATGGERARRRKTRQSRSVRQLHSFRSPVNSVDRAGTPCSSQDEEKQEFSGVCIHDRRVSEAVHESSSPSQFAEPASLPASARGCHRRLVKSCQRSCLREKPGGGGTPIRASDATERSAEYNNC